MIVSVEHELCEAARSGPNDPLAYFWIAEALCCQGRLPEAVLPTCFDKMDDDAGPESTVDPGFSSRRRYSGWIPAALISAP